MPKELSVTSTPEIDALIASNAPVAIGVSGGKDSQAAALATFEHLDVVGHTGPRLLIHSDLGRLEWKDSLPVCERLAKHLGTDLIVVRKGDLMDRWNSRWRSSLRRYANLETVVLVPPWSTPSMRFCTSEFKTHIIGAELRRRFRGRPIINVTGVRREESLARAKGSIASWDADRKTITWRPISDWTVEQVFSRINSRGLALHPAYTVHGLSRVSCKRCIMQNKQDQLRASSVSETVDIDREIVGLEIRSTFAFQGSRWLGDVAPHLLSDEMLQGLTVAKQKAATRMSLEKLLTKDMLYCKPKRHPQPDRAAALEVVRVERWPMRKLTDEEAAILAGVRRGVCELLGIESKYLDIQSIHGRYAELMAANAARRDRSRGEFARRRGNLSDPPADVRECVPRDMPLWPLPNEGAGGEIISSLDDGFGL